MSNANHHDWLLAEAGRLLDFGKASADRQGGFAYLDGWGRPDPAQDRQLWINCRMTHCFALGHLLGRIGCQELAQHGITALLNTFADREHDGWYAAVGVDGPSQTAKQAYGMAFVLLAASSAEVAGISGAAALLRHGLAYWEQYFFDPAYRMAVDEWNADHSWLDDYRGANANMHTVEALLAVADVTGEDRWRQLSLGIAERLINRQARGNDWLLPEHYDSQWVAQLDFNSDQVADPFKPYGATIGHLLEWSRLLLQLSKSLADPPAWLAEAAEGLFQRAVSAGWAVDGADGFVYTVDWQGQPVVHQRMHWVVAEAIGAAAVLHQSTDDPVYTGYYDRWWDYARRYLIDLNQGSWYHELDRHNQPAATVWPGKPDIYHAFQACLIPLTEVGKCLSVALAGRQLRPGSPAGDERTGQGREDPTSLLQ